MCLRYRNLSEQIKFFHRTRIVRKKDSVYFSHSSNFTSSSKFKCIIQCILRFVDGFLGHEEFTNRNMHCIYSFKVSHSVNTI